MKAGDMQMAEGGITGLLFACSEIFTYTNEACGRKEISEKPGGIKGRIYFTGSF